MMLSVRIIPKYCSCMNLIGRDQRYLEESDNANYQAMELGYRRMCCLTYISDPPLHFIKSTDSTAFVDESKTVPDRDHRHVPPIRPHRVIPSFPSETVAFDYSPEEVSIPEI